MADNPIMKTLTIDGVTYEIYDEKARQLIAQLQQSGTGADLTEAQIAALDGMLKIAAYTKDPSDAYAAFKTAFGITDSGDVHTHSYTSAVTTAATCTTAGVRTYTCSCGHSYTEAIPATGHSYDEGVVTTPATCTETGVKTFTCSKCGETYTEAIPATGHNYVDGVCTVCGATDPTYSPDVTLSSISATYSGGSVPVGTAVSDLTDITVTAHYSDGISETVTGYTLSGTIAEGSNTITVSYGGMTTTFTVTGVAESTEPIDTSVKIAKTGYGFNTSATEEVSKAAVSISEYYDVPDGYTGKVTYFFPDNGTSGIGSALKMQMCNDANEKVEYWSLSVGTAEKTVTFYHAQATKFRFSIETASVDNAYMYYTGTGVIVFAGKNTKYYGMRNISEYTGA